MDLMTDLAGFHHLSLDLHKTDDLFELVGKDRWH